MTSTQHLAHNILEAFPHEPTSDQEILIQKLSLFLLSNEPNKTFLIKGYAGTGKTTIISTLVKILPQLKLKPILMAPTGRAAKVMSAYAGIPAQTIHKSIYKTGDPEEAFAISVRENTHKNALFLIDEASMISSETSGNKKFQEINILEDILTYVFSGENCSLMFIGDTAQLPPIGIEMSLALNGEYLKAAFHLSLHEFELKNVVRQAESSGILHNATKIRQHLELETIPPFKFQVQDFTDLRPISGDELEDTLQTAYSKAGDTETIIICRSNKRANLFNNEIRKRIFFREGEINAGDKIMIVKNNYLWLSQKVKGRFIANGDTAEILRIRNFETIADTFQFADATIRLIEYPEEKDIEVKLLLNTLQSETPALTEIAYRQLYNLISEDFNHVSDKFERMKLLRTNPYLNALQIKFAYAMTCHKTQGGQWEQVFIEQGYLTEQMLNREFYRWLYTALTRSKEKVYLINFNSFFYL